MRKYSILSVVGFLFHLIFAGQLFAQISVGVREGVNLAQIAFHSSEAIPAKPKAGLNLALLLNIPLNSLMSIQVEPGFTQLGTKGVYDDMHTHYDVTHTEKFRLNWALNYLELPVLFQLTPKIGKVEAIMNLGPEIRFRVGKLKVISNYEYFENGVLDEDESDYSPGVDDNNFTKFDFGIASGIGVAVPVKTFKVFAEARYHFGLSNLINKEEYKADYDQDFDGTFQNRNLSLSVGVLFPLNKK